MSEWVVGWQDVFLSKLTSKNFNSGATVIEEGKHNDTFYIIKSGSVKVVMITIAIITTTIFITNTIITIHHPHPHHLINTINTIVITIITNAIVLISSIIIVVVIITFAIIVLTMTIIRITTTTTIAIDIIITLITSSLP